MRNILFLIFLQLCFFSAPALSENKLVRSSAERVCDAGGCELSVYIENNERLCTKIVSDISANGGYVKNSISSSDFFLAAKYDRRGCASSKFFGVYEHEIGIISDGVNRYFDLISHGRAALKVNEIDSRAMDCVVAGKNLNFVHAEMDGDGSRYSGVVFRIAGCGKDIDAHVPLAPSIENYITLSYSSYVIDADVQGP